MNYSEDSEQTTSVCISSAEVGIEVGGVELDSVENKKKNTEDDEITTITVYA